MCIRDRSQTVTITDGNQRCNFTLEPGNFPGSYTISGSTNVAGIAVTLWQTGGKVEEVTTDGDGNYTFLSISPGEYTVKAGGGRAANGEYYEEQSKVVTITDGNQECSFTLNFNPALSLYSISGSTNVAGITVTLWNAGEQVGRTTTDGNGNYTFLSLAPGEYTVKTGGWLNDIYYPEQSQTITITDGNQACNFTLNPGNVPGTYSISGTMSNSSGYGIEGISVTLWNAEIGRASCRERV